MLSRILPVIVLLMLCRPGEGRANPVDCGGNSISFAEVVPPHRAKLRNAPIRVGPDSLCADLIEDRPQAIESIQLSIDPAAGRQSSPVPPGQSSPVPPGSHRRVPRIHDRPAPPGHDRPVTPGHDRPAPPGR
jgi:hypothetical protein